MGLLDIWVERFEYLWANRPENAMALAMQMLEVGSPMKRPIFRDVVFDTDGNSTDIFVMGPASAGTPLRILKPVGKDVLIFQEFSLRVTATDGSAISSLSDTRLTSQTFRFAFGNQEVVRPELPRFTPLHYLSDTFGAIKPQLVIPREQDLRCYLKEDGGGVASRVKLSVVCRSEPRRLMEAARLVEPDTVGMEGKLA